MPTFSAIQAKVVPVIVPVDDFVFNLKIRPSALTPALEQSLTSAEDATDALVGAFCELIAEWDVTDDAGVMMPITPDFVRQFPSTYLLKFLVSVKDAVSLGESNGAT